MSKELDSLKVFSALVDLHSLIGKDPGLALYYEDHFFLEFEGSFLAYNIHLFYYDYDRECDEVMIKREHKFIDRFIDICRELICDGDKELLNNDLDDDVTVFSSDKSIALSAVESIKIRLKKKMMFKVSCPDERLALIKDFTSKEIASAIRFVDYSMG